jgi:hypothetical protein
MRNPTIYPGAVVRFREVIEDGDDALRFRVVELRGPRILLESVGAPFDGWRFRPSQVVRLDAVEVASDA